MDSVYKATRMVLYASLLCAGCAAGVLKPPGQADTASDELKGSDENCAWSDEDAGGVADDESATASAQSALGNQYMVRATDNRVWKTTGTQNNPHIRKRGHPKECDEKPKPRFRWIFEEIPGTNLVRIRSAFASPMCVTKPQDLTKPVELAPCGNNLDQLFDVYPDPDDCDRICWWIPGLCISYSGNKLVATTYANAPPWCRESCP